MLPLPVMSPHLLPAVVRPEVFVWSGQLRPWEGGPWDAGAAGGDQGSTGIFGLFRFVSVCFGCFDIHFRFGAVHCETNLFVSVVSIDIRNTETNRNKIFNGFENEPKQTRNRSCFGYFRFDDKNFFICFVDTLNVRLRVLIHFFKKLFYVSYESKKKCYKMLKLHEHLQ